MSTDRSLEVYGAAVPEPSPNALGVVKVLDVVEEGTAELVPGAPAFGVVDPGQLSLNGGEEGCCCGVVVAVSGLPNDWCSSSSVIRCENASDV